jgi:hypothetical protein
MTRSTAGVTGDRPRLRAVARGGRWQRFAPLLLALAVALVTVRPAGAENRVLVRGNYYREISTRVLQPMVATSVDVPDERFTIGAEYLLDAITSASIATGTQAVTGGDRTFTESRHEAVVRLGSRLGPWTLGSSFRFSTETDYEARGLGATVAREVFDRAGTISVGYAYNFDRVYQITGQNGQRAPWCGGGFVDDCAVRRPGERANNLLQSHYLSLGYAHAVTPKLLLQTSLELADARGPQDNPYRALLILNSFPESHPRVRQRLSWTLSPRWHLPRARLTFDPRYRYYADDWGIAAHAIDGRVHVRATRHLRFRARYRYYTQSAADFWRDDGIYTGEAGELRSADRKMDDWYSNTVGGQLTWHLDGLAQRSGWRWAEGAFVQATYNQIFYVFETPADNLYCGEPRRTCPARQGDLSFGLTF